MFDAGGVARRRREAWMFPTPGLNAGLFVGRHHAIGIAEGASLPDAFIEIQDGAGLLGKLRISGEDPTSVKPRSNRILRQPSPDGGLSDGSDQSPTHDLPLYLCHAEAGQGQTAGIRQLTGQRLHFNDHFGGESEAAGLCGEPPPARPDDVRRNVCATYTRSGRRYPVGLRCLCCPNPGRRRGRSWPE